MRLPIHTAALTFIMTGDPTPIRAFGSDDMKSDAQGRPLFRVPVLVTGTGDRNDPTTTVTVPGPLPQLPRGPVRFQNLSISTWTLRGNDGRERNGVTLRADAVDVAK
ncbi:MAG: hypothetical protein ACYC3W_02220 [Candidatus Nanopelagicales bacterium]